MASYDIKSLFDKKSPPTYGLNKPFGAASSRFEYYFKPTRKEPAPNTYNIKDTFGKTAYSQNQSYSFGVSRSLC